MNVNEVVMIFCQYGFRKASMEDIAKAADLSRQSIYKKFKSKEGVFEWAIMALTQDAHSAAMAALNDESQQGPVRIIEAFDRWAGDFVPMIRGTPHGSEVLERALEIFRDKGHAGDELLYANMARLLIKCELASSRQQADDKVFALSASAKGLLLRAESPQEFTVGMARIVKAIS
ncbi:transcriptional regulator, TetR family [Cohaesibacter marisflavi]|uniref:Transcriptional regulator, TetR family n=2 Tax=Cohaesibacter marisflavi TaxID=655353 RepID=A0A1I5EML0_9HYPH|nr:TetR/AcrR family transcriptional regulator [Cohaesibacter marisflavi]SFO12762.1 transcriptional regulator, TetR family [Cohaesibacter marisflavi]